MQDTKIRFASTLLHTVREVLADVCGRGGTTAGGGSSTHRVVGPSCGGMVYFVATRVCMFERVPCFFRRRSFRVVAGFQGMPLFFYHLLSAHYILRTYE